MPCCSIYPWSRCLSAGACAHLIPRCATPTAHTHGLNVHPCPARLWMPTQGSPDVVYAYTPKSDVAVEVSTCGSLFDTRLYVFDDPANPQVGTGNAMGWGRVWLGDSSAGWGRLRPEPAQRWHGTELAWLGLEAAVHSHPCSRADAAGCEQGSAAHHLHPCRWTACMTNLEAAHRHVVKFTTPVCTSTQHPPHRTTLATMTTPAAPPTARPPACQPLSRCAWASA